MKNILDLRKKYPLEKIALYLEGKFPPYYRAGFDKLHLIELIDFWTGSDTSDLFKVFDSKDFYLMALRFAERRREDRLGIIINKLNIPKEIL